MTDRYKNRVFRPKRPPKKGSAFYAWKKAQLECGEPVLVKLRVPARAGRTRRIDRRRFGFAGPVKQRAEYVYVEHIETLEGRRLPKETVARPFADFPGDTYYQAGKKVYAKDCAEPSPEQWSHQFVVGWNSDPSVVCTAGIHFYSTRKEAYYYWEN